MSRPKRPTLPGESIAGATTAAESFRSTLVRRCSPHPAKRFTGRMNAAAGLSVVLFAVFPSSP
jgi:hypothetical protein